MKFKVWCKDKKKWEKRNCFLKDNGQLFEQSYHENYFGIHLLDAATHITVFPTGLKDKNGKEIYEGDIVKREPMSPGGLDRIGKITFEDGVIWLESNVDSVCLYDEIDELEVIGNIYENPELLEVEEDE